MNVTFTLGNLACWQSMQRQEGRFGFDLSRKAPGYPKGKMSFQLKLPIFNFCFLVPIMPLYMSDDGISARRTRFLFGNRSVVLSVNIAHPEESLLQPTMSVVVLHVVGIGSCIRVISRLLQGYLYWYIPYQEVCIKV